MNIEIFSKKWCSYCSRAKDLLTEKGLNYIDYNVEEIEWNLNEMKRRAPGAQKVPQIFIDGSLIGGYDELRKYFKNLESS